MGDSLLLNAEDDDVTSFTPVHSYLTDQIVAAGNAASIVAVAGSSTGDLIPNNGNPWNSFDGFPAPGAQIVVEAEGTNDMKTSTSIDQTAVPLAQAEQNLTRFLNTTAARCDVLVEISETTPSWGLDKTGPVWNSFLHTLQSSGTRAEPVVIVPWATILASHPEYVANGPHQTALGRAAYRDAISAGVAKCVQLITVPG